MPIKIILPAQMIPTRARVTKVRGEVEYFVKDEITVSGQSGGEAGDSR